MSASTWLEISCFLGSQSVSAFLENVAGKMDLSLSPFKFSDNQFLAKYLMIPQVEAQIWHLARTCLLGEAFAYCHSFQKSKSGQVMNGKNTIGICFLHLNSLRNPPWLCQKWSWNKDQLGRQRHKEFIIENRLRKLSMIELISQKLAVSLLPGMICETLVCFSLLQLRHSLYHVPFITALV